MKESATAILVDRIPKILSRKTSEDGLTFNEVWGQLERDKVASKYLKNAKLFVTGSTREAFPVVIVESMASGIPFICTDVGCVRFLPGGVVAKNKKGALLISIIVISVIGMALKLVALPEGIMSFDIPSLKPVFLHPAIQNSAK